jgi:hypothetical protein
MSESRENGAAALIELCGTDVLHSVRARALASDAIESGQVVFLRDIGFELSEQERDLVCDSSVTLPTRKEKESRNGRPTVIYDPARGQLLRSRAKGLQRDRLEAMMARYANWSRSIIHDLFPSYLPGIVDDRVTFRPCERALPQGLHMDASYGRPTEGRGMLRVFCNVNPHARPRVWAVGEPFEPVARRVLPSASIKKAGPLASLLSRLSITSGRRTDYDLLMEDIRARVKSDAHYQAEGPRRVVEFPSGSTWIALTDLVLHGAVSGQYSLDRTFFLPPSAMHDPERSSLKTLERLSGRALV